MVDRCSNLITQQQLRSTVNLFHPPVGAQFNGQIHPVHSRYHQINGGRELTWSATDLGISSRPKTPSVASLQAKGHLRHFNRRAPTTHTQKATEKGVALSVAPKTGVFPDLLINLVRLP